MAVEPVVSELPVEPPLTLKIRNSDDCSQIQSDILNIVNWCYLNKMRIDIQKWFTMTFGFRGTIFDFKISDTIINRVTQMKYLGVILDPKLQFKLHTAHVIKLSNKLISFLLRMCFFFKNLTRIKYLYNCLIRSILEYLEPSI